MFKQYPSLLNFEHEKELDWWLRNMPHLAEEKYIVREKLDGANIVAFIPADGGAIKWGRRTAFLEAGEKFYDLEKVVAEKAGVLCASLREKAQESGDSFRAYFELYGEGINKRVNYGKGKHLALIDLAVCVNNNQSNIFYTQDMLETFMFNLFLEKLEINEFLTIKTAPILLQDCSFTEAMEFSAEFNSKIIDIEDNPAEGVVIQPLYVVPHSPRGERFIIKKKAPGFEEVKAKFKPKKEPVVLSEAQTLFLDYLNENRVLSVFSKHGEISGSAQIGEYIKLILADAKEDFIKDHPQIEANDKELYTKAGNIIVKLLRAHL